jgi:xylan 1,4-beta-xylosidase
MSEMALTKLPDQAVDVNVDARPTGELLETWRHALGHGGVNWLPLPGRVVEGVRRLRPRLIRVFIQEFFQIYRGDERFDWSRLDQYMDALEATGAKVVAAITIKPRAIYPEVGQSIWRPRNVQEWQNVIWEMVRRYSVESPIVTHWEIGNEPDIGENGGCPYLIPDPAEYAEYYAMTVRPILEAFPEARVGGPALANVSHALLPGLVEFCHRTHTQLDFVSWHLYHDSPAKHAACVRQIRSVLDAVSEVRPEMMVTEWNSNLALKVSVAEQARDPRRAAIVAAAILDMMEAGLDWSFYYHIWDQACFHDDFEPFFSEDGVRLMTRHWNEIPHRLGMFGVGGEVRPQYFVYQMLGNLGTERLAAEAPDDLRVLAGSSEDGVGVLIVNHNPDRPEDRVVNLTFRNLEPGVRLLAVGRIDEECRWNAEALELEPVERRMVSVAEEFRCQVLVPADSVVAVRLAPEIDPRP